MMISVAGRIVSAYEFELLAELWRQGDNTAQMLGITVGPHGWKALRTLDSLAARGLVRSYRHRSGVLAWALTTAGSEPFRDA